MRFRLLLAAVLCSVHPALAQSAPADVPGAPAALPDSGPVPPSSDLPRCRVTWVVDGDTIECAGIGRVRLIGIDTPERGQVPFGAEATDALERILARAARITLELDLDQRDRYGRLLAYVWADRRMANWLMARSGYALQLTYAPNVRYVERFSEAVSAARNEGRGLWATGGFTCAPKDNRRGRC
jgi:micrococcal nuclease